MKLMYFQLRYVSCDFRFHISNGGGCNRESLSLRVGKNNTAQCGKHIFCYFDIMKIILVCGLFKICVNIICIFFFFGESLIKIFLIGTSQICRDCKYQIESSVTWTLVLRHQLAKYQKEFSSGRIFIKMQENKIQENFLSQIFI